MSGAKHTPGPWVAAPYEGFGPRTTVRQGCERTGMRIASTFETTSPRNVDRNEANARLIAAAPDLLAALKKARATIWIERQSLVEVHSGPDGVLDSDGASWVDELDSELQEIDAAIAKATGSAE